jgi:hypothetical protein
MKKDTRIEPIDFQNHGPTPGNRIEKKKKIRRYNHAAENRLPKRSFHPITLGACCVGRPKRWIYLSLIAARKSGSLEFACLFFAVHCGMGSQGRASPLMAPLSHQTRVSLGRAKIRCIEVHASRKLTVSSGTFGTDSEL